MSGYTKLFSSILDSTIWDEDCSTRILWITMLAMVNKDGIVEASMPGLANRARLPLDSVKEAIDLLTSPDSDSRSLEFEGRRIERVNGGWKLLNYQKYRDIRAEDERREYMRKYMQKYRTKVNDGKPNSKPIVNVALAKLAKAAADINTIPPIIPPSDANFVKNLIEEQNFKSKIQNPEPRIEPPRNCMMPECGKAIDPKYKPFCSQACKDYADFLNSKYGPST